MTAAPTEHDGLAVHSGTGSDGDNVVAFPVPRGRQALVAALRGLQPSAADIRWRSKGDPVACHLAAARIERFPTLCCWQSPANWSATTRVCPASAA